MHLIDSSDKRSSSIRELTCVTQAFCCHPELVLNSEGIHNDASELPAVCQIRNLSFGYSHSLSMVL